jgi:hypothetical protein
VNTSLATHMIGAELLKLRRNRGVMAFALFLTVGVTILFFGVSAIEHASDPVKNRPAGGIHGFGDGVRAIGLFFGMLAAILIGSEAGTTDRTTGVFRDLAVTGRSRLALFAVRAPAAMIVSLALSAAAYALILIGTFLFAASEPTPSLTLILQSAGWIALCEILVTTLAVGVGSLTGSRAATLTGVIGWQAIATNLLLNVGFLGDTRDGLLTAALTQLTPITGDRQTVTMASGVAVIVLLGWLVVPTALGAWRTQTQDA